MLRWRKELLLDTPCNKIAIAWLFGLGIIPERFSEFKLFICWNAFVKFEIPLDVNTLPDKSMYYSYRFLFYCIALHSISALTSSKCAFEAFNFYKVMFWLRKSEIHFAPAPSKLLNERSIDLIGLSTAAERIALILCGRSERCL